MDVDRLIGELREGGAAMDELLLVHAHWQPLDA
jgi:hypothetical protein